MFEQSVVCQPARGRTGRGAWGFIAGALLSVEMLAGCEPQPGGAASDSVGLKTAASEDRSLASVPGDRNGSAEPSIPARQARQSSTAEPAVLFIGTSLTAGYGLDPDDAFPAVVGRMLDSAGHPARIFNAGVSGETSAGARARIDWVLRQPADVVVLETGANDGLRGLSVNAARDNIQAILDRIRATKPAARVLLVQMEAPPNLGSSYTAAFRSMYPELAKKNRVELVPFMLEGVAGIPSLNQDDGIHPNRAGARIVARNIYTALTRHPIVATATR